MIRLTRLNGSTVLVQSERIEHVEETPDTVLCLASGQKLVVRESLNEITELVRQWKRSVTHRETLNRHNAVEEEREYAH
jgi:flagellar protein FlbD